MRYLPVAAPGFAAAHVTGPLAEALGDAPVIVFDRVDDFQVGVDRLELNTAYGYPVWAMEGGDGVGGHGTWVVYGWNQDAVFLSGVTGAGVDALLA